MVSRELPGAVCVVWRVSANASLIVVGWGHHQPARRATSEVAKRGTGLRGLTSDHVVRETAIITTGAGALDEHRVGSDAYSTEPRWLDEDLVAAGMPPLQAFTPKRR